MKAPLTGLFETDPFFPFPERKRLGHAKVIQIQGTTCRFPFVWPTSVSLTILRSDKLDVSPFEALVFAPLILSPLGILKR